MKISVDQIKKKHFFIKISRLKGIQVKPFFLFECCRQGLRQGEQKVGHQYLGDPAQKKVFIVHSFSFFCGLVIYLSGPSLYNGYYGWHEDPERDKPKAQA